jgi:hypothetical protein
MARSKGILQSFGSLKRNIMVENHCHTAMVFRFFLPSLSKI